MTKTELVYACNNYNGSGDEFCEIIGEFLELDEKNMDWLYHKMKHASRRVIEFWGRGYYCPIRKVRCEVIRIVRNKLAEEPHLHAL